MRDVLRRVYEYEGEVVEVVDELSDKEVIDECWEIVDSRCSNEFVKELESYFEW